VSTVQVIAKLPVVSPAVEPLHVPRFHRPLLLIAGFCAVALAGLTALVYTTPLLPIDAAIERAEQAINVGSLLPVFSVYMQIGGPYGVIVEAIVVALVLALNRISWRLLVAGALGSGLYFLINASFFRARPSVPDVLRVTEHPAASSFPSGHTVLFVFYAVILMTCLGLKFFPRRWQPLGWMLAVLFVLVGGFSRNYSGAHWPTDVLAGGLIGVGWFSFVLSVRWISDPVFYPRAAHESPYKPAFVMQPGLRVDLPRFIFNPWFTSMQRFGLLVRGVLYTLVGVVAIAAIVGVRESVDLQGSVTLIQQNALKLPIGIIAAAGLLGYALWSVVRAIVDPLERGSTFHGVMSRMAFLGSASAYTGLALFSIQFAIGQSSAGGGLPFGIDKLLGAQLGPPVLAVFGAVVVITGIGQFGDAWIAPFKTDFLPQLTNPHQWRAWVWAGRIGLFGRGIAFTAMGLLMVTGAFTGHVDWNYGLTRAFEVLLVVPGGATLVLIVALGFIALGLQSATSPPVLRMKRGLDPPVRKHTTKES
jgi:membrane-associated phospholipid phosphatase